MKSILFVGSSTYPFLPANAHRLRHLAWGLERFDWKIFQLFPNEEFQNREWHDKDSEGFFNHNVTTFFAKPVFKTIFRFLKINGICWRAFFSMAQLGCEIIKRNKIDLVYLSTTQFPLFLLGVYWKYLTKVPYILDYQDPWIKTKKLYSTTSSKFKEDLSGFIGSYLESISIKNCSGIIAVSPHYLGQLKLRYKNASVFKKNNTLVIPFGYCEADFGPDNFISKIKPIDSSEFIISYVGVGSFIMLKSFQAFLNNLKKVYQKFGVKIKIALYGTDGLWKEGKTKILENAAKEVGLSSLVFEDPTILPYSKSVEIIKNSDALIVLGVEDPAYMPSKLFSYAFSQKPLLASLHVDSQALGYFQKYPELGNVITFPETEQNFHSNQMAIESFLHNIFNNLTFKRNFLTQEFSPKGTSEKHNKFFHKVLEN